MHSLDRELSRRLDDLREQGLLRELRRVDSPQSPRILVNGQTLLNFSSNDYLGLANEPALKEAAIRAVERYGAGAGASRLICGSLAPHHELEDVLAAFKRTEAALSFSTGYTTALGTICALMGKDDVVVLDKLVHASIVDAARLSGAKLRVFSHNDLNDLEEILKWADGRKSKFQVPGSKSRVLVVTESVFSMDGDRAPLREIVALKETFGAWLMVDEAHATGLYGDSGRGLAQELGVADRIEVQMGTLGKALGASGGFICGSRVLVDFLLNRARSFIFSTAPVPAAAAAATAGIHFVQSSQGEQRRRTLWERAAQCRAGIPPVSGPSLSSSKSTQAGKDGDKLEACPTRSAILPLIVGDESAAVSFAAELRKRGIFVPAIRYPTVARGSARLRFTVTAAHAAEDVATLTQVLTQIVNRKS